MQLTTECNMTSFVCMFLGHRGEEEGELASR